MTGFSESTTDGIHRRTALKNGLLTTVALAGGIHTLSTAGSANAADCDVLVDPSDPNADATTIQGGVDAASAGDTVCVNGGTYREQVRIDKDLHLTNAPGSTPTIEALDSLQTVTIAESLSTWAPMVFAHGGSLSGGSVAGPGTVDVSLSGFEFDGRGDTGQSGRKTAVLYRNVRGSSSESHVADNDVINLGTPGNSIGIVAYGDSDVRVEDNTLTGFGRGGIGANGDGGLHPSPRIAVRNNLIDSDSGTGGSAPNGVQIGFGAAGEVKNNAIKDCRYAEDLSGLFQASGILVFESDGVQVKRNTLENNDVAVAASSWGWFLGSANGNQVVHNDISDALIGVHLRATAWDQDGGLAFLTNRNPEVVNAKVTNNDIADPPSGPAGEIGVAVQPDDRGPGDEFEPIVENNKVIRNTITGFERPTEDEGADTKSQAQVIEP